MNILKNVSLKLYSTMRLGGQADYLVNAITRDDLLSAVEWAEAKGLPIRVIGSGSNIIWRDEGFKGLVIVNKIKGFRVVEEDGTSAVYKIGAGENWDKIVARAVELNLQGIECLSLIPGTAGATPVQNVGAYGQDISQTIVQVEAYDLMQKSFVTLSKDECALGYRASRFKTVDNGRFLICSISVRLSKLPPQPPFYEALQSYFDQHNQTSPSLEQIRAAVIKIRSSKLPDPLQIPNSGSFFSNPIISNDHYTKLLQQYPDIKAWPTETGHKVSAAWLIEQAGFKDKKDPDTGMTTWKNQPLVLVNYRSQRTADLVRYQDKITNKIYEMFNINIKREPEILPN